MIDKYHRIEHVFNVICNRCAAMARAGRSEQEAEEAARQDGWYAEGGVHLCPKCRAKTG